MQTSHECKSSKLLLLAVKGGFLMFLWHVRCFKHKKEIRCEHLKTGVPPGSTCAPVWEPEFCFKRRELLMCRTPSCENSCLGYELRLTIGRLPEAYVPARDDAPGFARSPTAARVWCLRLGTRLNTPQRHRLCNSLRSPFLTQTAVLPGAFLPRFMAILPLTPYQEERDAKQGDSQ